MILSAIEELNPGKNISFRSPVSRHRNLLCFRNIEGMSIQECGHELGLSERQTYRDLRGAEKQVAAILWTRSRQGLNEKDHIQNNMPSAIQEEMSHLDLRSQPVDYCLALRNAIKAVERLADQNEVEICLNFPDEPVEIATDPAMTQVFLVNLFSNTIKQANAGEICINLLTRQGKTSYTIKFAPKPGLSFSTSSFENLTLMASRLGLRFSVDDPPEGQRIFLVSMGEGCPIALVIDDNEAFHDLLRRYLTNQTCMVEVVRTSQDGLRLARQLSPDVIFLDIMMPDMDGWELLQRLKYNPHTKHIPVVICSALPDDELAYSLGASC